MNVTSRFMKCMRDLVPRLAALAATALLTACASTAPPYQASATGADITAKLPNSIAVGKFEFEKGREAELNSVGARAGTFISPINNSYADYFADAATKELKSGGRFDAASPRVLSAVIVKNHLSAASLQVNESELAVRFRLSNAGKEVFDKPVQVRSEWESAFLGAVAIPRALDNYIVTIQKLMRSLFSDPDFVAATGAR